MNLIIVSYIFITSLISLSIIRKHILLCLLILEFVVLSILILIFIYLSMYSNRFNLYVFFITFYVCEGVLGIRVLVYIIRCHGNDYLNSMFIW